MLLPKFKQQKYHSKIHMINTKIQDQIYHTKIQFVTDFRRVLDISKKIKPPTSNKNTENVKFWLANSL